MIQEKTREVFGEDYDFAVVTGILTLGHYEKLEEEGYSTKRVGVNDSGNDYWDLEIWFVSEDAFEDEEERKELCQEVSKWFRW